MSIDKKKLQEIRQELQGEKKEGYTNVRIRNDVYAMTKEGAEKEGKSIANFVTIAIVEKLLKE